MKQLQSGRRSQPSDSPRIVALGGGHGLHNLLRGLKAYTKNLTAIVTVADDGGGSGVLRQELGIPAPGDIRNCMQALANVEPLMEQLLDYRFTEGSLSGQSFGNLLLAALNGISPSFYQAVSGMQKVLAITGQVLPVTADNVQLCALFEDGARVCGESKIARAKKEQGCRIQTVTLLPDCPAPLPQALEAIALADLILIGPGSLYTSLIPNLLVPRIADALRRSTAPRMYIANLMSEAGGTEGYTIGDHIAALYDHGGPELLTSCLVNSAPIPEPLLHQAARDGVFPTEVDRERIAALGVKLYERPLVATERDHICHCPSRLSAGIQELYEATTIRVFHSHQGRQYILESE